MGWRDTSPDEAVGSHTGGGPCERRLHAWDGRAGGGPPGGDRNRTAGLAFRVYAISTSGSYNVRTVWYGDQYSRMILTAQKWTAEIVGHDKTNGKHEREDEGKRKEIEKEEAKRVELT